MAIKTVPDLKELFKQAAEIASHVPESMHEAAFNRALDMLTSATPSSPTKTSSGRVASGRTKSAGKAAPASDNDQTEALIQSIDSTQHPGVISATKALDRALMVLQIVRRDHNVDGLSPKAIAMILTDKFRVRTKDGAVRMALSGAMNLVNRVASGNGFAYQIMGPGEDYLAHASESGQTEISTRTKVRNNSAKRAARKAVSGSGSRGDVAEKPIREAKIKKSPSKATKLGPKAEIMSLVSSGYFSEPRTSTEIQDVLKKKRGVQLGAPQVSLVLLRLVRDKVLDRDENDDKQYEYRQP